MTERKQAVLVTGGAGYVGSHACKALAAAGYEPVVLDSMVYGHQRAVQWGPLIEGDTADVDLVCDVLRQYRPVAVMHFAAFAYVGESVSDPLKYYGNNVCGTLGLLQGMQRCKLNRLVFSSTCATYGVPAGKTIAESHPQQPINPYGRSKLMIEHVLRDCETAHGLKSLSLRYFNAAGADADCEIGEAHDPETHLIPLVLDAACGRRPAITINGTDYDTPDGTCVRDYIHVTDLADAHVRALDWLKQDTGSDAFNLGVGRGFSVREVIDVAHAVTGRDIPVIEGPRRPGDPPYLVAAPGRAADALGWRPRFTGLDEIVRSAWAWHQRR